MSTSCLSSAGNYNLARDVTTQHSPGHSVIVGASPVVRSLRSGTAKKSRQPIQNLFQ